MGRFAAHIAFPGRVDRPEASVRQFRSSRELGGLFVVYWRYGLENSPKSENHGPISIGSVQDPGWLFAATGWPLYRQPGRRGAWGYDGGDGGAAPGTPPGKYNRIGGPNRGAVPHRLGPMGSGQTLYFSDVKIKKLLREVIRGRGLGGFEIIAHRRNNYPRGFKIYAISRFAQRPYDRIFPGKWGGGLPGCRDPPWNFSADQPSFPGNPFREKFWAFPREISWGANFREI